MKTIKVYDEINSRYFFVQGVYQVSTEIENSIFQQSGIKGDTKSLFYQPKTKKLYLFHHADVWGRGTAEEIYNELPAEEVTRIETYAKNRKQILNILFSIPCERKGDNYIYFESPLAKPCYEYEGWNREEQRMNDILAKFPQIKEIENLGGSVRIGEKTLEVE